MITKLRFPFPPSINHIWRINPRGGNYLSKKAKEFYAKTSNIIRAANTPRYSRDDRLFIRIILHRGDRRLYDCDNHVKCIQDALVRGAVMQSDAQVDLVLVERGIVKPHNGHALIEIALIGDVRIGLTYITEVDDEP